LAVAAGLSWVVYSSPDWIGWLSLGFGAVLLTMVAYVTFLLPRIVYHSQPKLKSEYRLSFSDEGILFKTDNIDATLQWSLYQSWRSDEEFYILYHGKRDLSVVPRRVLRTEDADRHFREMLERNIGPPSP
jgi:hypothetical protein